MPNLLTRSIYPLPVVHYLLSLRLRQPLSARSVPQVAVKRLSLYPLLKLEDLVLLFQRLFYNAK